MAKRKRNDAEMTNEDFMRLALRQAQNAMDNGEVPVGCVFVRSGEVIARGANATNQFRNATKHAEMIAISSLPVDTDFSDVTVYVTVEPCIMCAPALMELRVKQVCFGAHNDRFGGCGSVMNIPQIIQARCAKYQSADNESTRFCQFIGGILRDEAVLQLRQFYTLENPSAPKPQKKANRKLKTEDLNLDGNL
ncbi:hypothetical protein MP228_006076 [Amoeboaphelidium protococcarum]|nr:hypothetical protein MP228_006076 [Amoeboaphelidium protococcarum]